MKKLILLLALAFSLMLNIVNAQEPDTNFWVTDGEVNVIAKDENFIYVGGSFKNVGFYTGSGIKLTTNCSSIDMDFPKVNGAIRTVVSDGIGGWYIGGDFTMVGSYTRNNIAHINSDKTVDEIWNPNAHNPVNKIAISGSDIYVGGMFDSIGGQERKGIAKLNNTNGNADASWNPNASWGHNTVVLFSLAISGSDIYVGGWFSNIGGQTRNYIAKLNNTNGNADSTWNPNPDDDFIDANVNTIAISGNDIYVGGGFTKIGGQYRNNIAKLNNTNGNADSTWNPNANNDVCTITISANDIYVGGWFASIGGQTRNRIAKLNNTNGNADSTWNPNANNWVNTIAISGSDIYAGGGFTSIDGKSIKKLVKLNNVNGNVDINWNPNVGNTVCSIAISENDVFVGGGFTSIGGQERNCIARFYKNNGNIDTTWNPNADYTVNLISISGSDIYVGGSFSNIGGQTRKYIAKLNYTNGNADSIWNPNPNKDFIDAKVNTIAISGNDIYVGGGFNRIGGKYRNHIAKLNNSNGNADDTWNPNANDDVYSIAISGNDIYVGGEYTSIGGQTRNRIAKLNNTNGSADLIWNPDADRHVNSIVISKNDVYVGGEFTQIGGQGRNSIARLNNTNGAADVSWNPDARVSHESNGKIMTIAIDEKNIYVGGYFNNIGGQTRNSIAKLNNTNGYADTKWNPNINFDTYINPNSLYSIVIIKNDVYVGGNFSNIGGQGRVYLAKLKRYSSSISGLVYFDENKNGIKDTIEQVLENQLIKIEQGFTRYLYTNNLGQYTFYKDSGNYTISCVSSYNYLTSNPVNYNITVDDTIINNFDFGLTSTEDVHNLGVFLSGGPTRPNMTAIYWINYKNYGTVQEICNIKFSYDSILNYVYSNHNPDLITDNVYTWINDTLAPFEEKSIELYFQVPSVEHLGDTLVSTVIMDYNSKMIVPNRFIADTLIQVITGSFDPNEKQVQPDRAGEENYTLFNEGMTYTIHFQNTGTDTAFNIEVVDTIDNNLNIESLNILCSSHAVEYSIEDSNIVVFDFNNILLPDSGANQTESNGFVKYYIEPKDGLDENTEVENTAYIYFDYNPAIVTNTTLNTLVSVLPNKEGIETKAIKQTNEISIYPSPTKGIVNIVLNNASQDNLQIEVISLTGKVVYKEQVSDKATSLNKQLNLADYSKGIYFIKVTNDKESFVKKVVVE